MNIFKKRKEKPPVIEVKEPPLIEVEQPPVVTVEMEFNPIEIKEN